MLMITDKEHFNNILKTANLIYPIPLNLNSYKKKEKKN